MGSVVEHRVAGRLRHTLYVSGDTLQGHHPPRHPVGASPRSTRQSSTWGHACPHADRRPPDAPSRPIFPACRPWARRSRMIRTARCFPFAMAGLPPSLAMPSVLRPVGPGEADSDETDEAPLRRRVPSVVRRPDRSLGAAHRRMPGVSRMSTVRERAAGMDYDGSGREPAPPRPACSSDSSRGVFLDGLAAALSPLARQARGGGRGGESSPARRSVMPRTRSELISRSASGPPPRCSTSSGGPGAAVAARRLVPRPVSASSASGRAHRAGRV